MTRQGPRRYADLHRLTEDERIKVIGESARELVVGVAIDSDRKKIARYIRKVTARFPTVKHIDTTASGIPKVVNLRFGPKGH